VAMGNEELLHGCQMLTAFLRRSLWLR